MEKCRKWFTAQYMPTYLVDKGKWHEHHCRKSNEIFIEPELDTGTSFRCTCACIIYHWRLRSNREANVLHHYLTKLIESCGSYLHDTCMHAFAHVWSFPCTIRYLGQSNLKTRNTDSPTFQRKKECMQTNLLTPTQMHAVFGECLFVGLVRERMHKRIASNSNYNSIVSNFKFS